MTLPAVRIIIASDVYQRDGIGVEVYQDDVLIMEIFRDDALKTRTITAFKPDIPLDITEAAIETFKKEVPWDFISSDINPIGKH